MAFTAVNNSEPATSSTPASASPEPATEPPSHNATPDPSNTPNNPPSDNSTPADSTSDAPPAKQIKRRRMDPPCTWCRNNHKTCDRARTCNNCSRRGLLCTYPEPQAKRRYNTEKRAVRKAVARHQEVVEFQRKRAVAQFGSVALTLSDEQLLQFALGGNPFEAPAGGTGAGMVGVPGGGMVPGLPAGQGQVMVGPGGVLAGGVMVGGVPAGMPAGQGIPLGMTVGQMVAVPAGVPPPPGAVMIAGPAPPGHPPLQPPADRATSTPATAAANSTPQAHSSSLPSAQPPASDQQSGARTSPSAQLAHENQQAINSRETVDLTGDEGNERQTVNLMTPEPQVPDEVSRKDTMDIVRNLAAQYIVPAGEESGNSRAGEKEGEGRGDRASEKGKEKEKEVAVEEEDPDA